MNARFDEIWVYLAASPLLGLTLTLLAYQGAVHVNKRCHGHPLANPVLLAVATLVSLLWITDTPYGTYFDGAQFVHFLLGPATVALAIPLYAQLARLKRLAIPLLGALLVGSLSAALSAVAIGGVLGASKATLLSLAPKSVTAPVAMGIADKIGGIPALAAVFAVVTGMVGALSGKLILDRLGVAKDSAGWMVHGFALGTAAHGIGAARALQVNASAGAYAGLALGLQVLLAALLIPLVFS